MDKAPRLSDAESVIRKIQQIYDHVEMLATAAGVATEIRDRISRSRDEIGRQEVEIARIVANIDTRSRELADQVNLARVLIHRTDLDMAQMLTHAGYEIERIASLGATLADEPRRIQNALNETREAMAQTANAMTADFAYLETHVQTVLNRMSLQAIQSADESQARIDREFQRLSAELDHHNEALFYIENELMRMAYRTMARMDRSLKHVTDQQEIFQATALFDLHTRFQEETSRTQAGLMGQFAELSAEIAHKQGVADETLAALGAEKDDLSRRKNRLDLELRNIRQEFNALALSSQNRLKDVLEERRAGAADKEREMDGLVAGSEKRLQALASDSQAAIEQARIQLSAEAAEARKEQAAHLSDMKEHTAAYLDRETEIIRAEAFREIQHLMSEKKSLTQFREKLESAIGDLYRDIDEKTEALKNQIGTLMEKHPQDMIRMGEKMQQGIREKLTELIKDMNARFGSIRDALQGRLTAAQEKLTAATDEMRQEVARRLSDMEERQAAFQDRIAKTFSDMVTDAVRQMESTLASQVNQVAEHQDFAHTENADRIKALETQVAAIRESLDRLSAPAAPSGIDPADPSEGGIESLARRIESIQEELKAIREKKPVFRF